MIYLQFFLRVISVCQLSGSITQFFSRVTVTNSSCDKIARAQVSQLIMRLLVLEEQEAVKEVGNEWMGHSKSFYILSVRRSCFCRRTLNNHKKEKGPLCMSTVLDHSGCYNKILQTGCLINNRIFFPQLQRMKSPNSGTSRISLC